MFYILQDVVDGEDLAQKIDALKDDINAKTKMLFEEQQLLKRKS